jgi:predicted glycosyltransferase
MGDREREALHALAEGRDDLRILDFVPDGESLIALADDVVAMGGYNSVCEILASRTRALIVPRSEPRREQVIRARRLAEMGALDTLAPADLDADAISSWLAAGDAEPRLGRAAIDMGGLRRAPALLEELLTSSNGRNGASPPDRRRFWRAPAGTGSVPA